jgi:cytochrome c553
MNKLLTTLFAFAVACVTVASHAQEIKGDPMAGQKKIDMCIGCHGIVGYQASFLRFTRCP